MAETTERLLRAVEASLFDSARDERERRTLRDPAGYDDMISYLRDARGFAVAAWCGGRECEARVKDDSSATIRCLPLAEPSAHADRCICCGRAKTTDAVWAQAY